MLSRSVPAHGLGGMERHLHLLARELVRLGHEVSVLTTAYPPRTDLELSRELRPGRTEPMQPGPVLLATGPSLQRTASLVTRQEGVEYFFLAGTDPGKYSRKWWSASRRAFRSQKPGLVHSQSIGAYGIVGDIRKRKLPLVATSHGTPLSDAVTGLRTHGFQTNPAHLLATVSKLPHHLKVYGSARRVIAVSPQLAAHIASAGLAPRERIRVVRNGIDTDFFTPGSGDQVRSGRGPVIFSLARVVREKGFQFLIGAMPAILAEHPDCRLVLGGTGPYLPALRELARKRGVGRAVEFLGEIPEYGLPARYRDCDLFAFATTHVEGLPLVLPEALACGKPLAASNIGGVPDVVKENETGFLFPPGDQEAVIKVLLDMLSDGRRLAGMGKAARLDAEKRFGARRMAVETARVYDEALAG